MILKSVALPRSQRFCASKADLKRTFGDIEPVHVYMGYLFPKFIFDSRCHHRPRLDGPVVASLSVSRDLTAIMQVFPVRRDDYSERATDDFREDILPGLRSWLISQLQKQQTAILGCEQVVVEWTGREHRQYFLRYL
jgi:hypothetical protein